MRDHEKRRIAGKVLVMFFCLMVVPSLGGCKKCNKCCSCTCMGTFCCGTARVESDSCLDCNEACRDACRDCPMETAQPCSGDSTVFPPICEDGMPFHSTVQLQQEEPALDILVVMDNSFGMEPKQATFLSAFAELITVLLDPPVNPETGVKIREPLKDLHLGVVSTDLGVGMEVPTCEVPLGDDGILQNAPRGDGCESSYPMFLSYAFPEGSDPDRAAVEKLANDFTCIAALGGTGCGFEQPLEAARKALTLHAMPGGPNGGFLRDEAVLAIIFFTEENDCSAADYSLFDPSNLEFGPYSSARCLNGRSLLYPVSDYTTAFRSLKENRGDVILGIVGGVPPGELACNGRGDELGGCLDLAIMEERLTPEEDSLEIVCDVPPGCVASGSMCDVAANPATRFIELAQSFADNAMVQSICSENYSSAVGSITNKILERLGGTSLDMPTYKDPDDPCRCLTECSVYETLSGDFECPSPKTRVATIMGDDCTYQSVCEIPQAGAFLDDCSLACGDANASYHTSGEGWYYIPASNISQESLGISGNVAPASDSITEIECCFH